MKTTKLPLRTANRIASLYNTIAVAVYMRGNGRGTPEQWWRSEYQAVRELFVVHGIRAIGAYPEALFSYDTTDVVWLQRPRRAEYLTSLLHCCRPTDAAVA